MPTNTTSVARNCAADMMRKPIPRVEAINSAATSVPQPMPKAMHTPHRRNCQLSGFGELVSRFARRIFHPGEVRFSSIRFR